MSRLTIALGIFAITTFIALGLGVSQAQADCQYLACTINCGGGDCFGSPGDVDDVICGTAGVDNIFAGKGSDTICAGNGGDFIFGGFGDDLIDGEGGADLIQGGWGEDDIDGGSGDDTIDAGQCNDIVEGGANPDTCTGGLGDDTITGCTTVDLGDETSQAGGKCDLFD